MSTQSSTDSRLQIGAIYLLLFIRDSDNTLGFHWALYHHRTPNSGYKFNVKQMGSGWICDSAPNTGIMRSFLLDGAMRIGFCDPSEADKLSWMDNVDLTQPPPSYDRFTCITWTFHCIRGLVKEGFVKCDDIEALQREAQAWGSLHHESANNGQMPRPVADSQSCKL